MTIVSDGFVAFMLVWNVVVTTLLSIYMLMEWRERAKLRRMLRGEE